MNPRDLMTTVPVQEAVGMVLCHDITEIVPGEKKGRAFSKGHVVREEDVDHLLRVGKEHLYVFDLKTGLVHENDAAERIARAAAGPGLDLTDVCEGRVNMTAACHGLLHIDTERLFRINSIEEVVLSTIHSGQEVPSGRPVAGTRVVPLVIEEEKLQQVEAICRAEGPILTVKPFKEARVGLVTTGSEIYHGRITDKFGPVLRKKFGKLGSTVTEQKFVSDDIAMTVGAIHSFLEQGVDLIAVTGGMSVDPDDLTPSSIRAAGGHVVTYGSPTFPGAMFMLAYIGDTPVVGLPGCVMYYRASIFDLVVPRILAGEQVTRDDIVAMGHGGFCAGCKECRYPICPFGKGA